MQKNKVCVYAISKNESKFVDRWMDSMSEADLIVVTDTGSEDATVEKLRKRGAVVYSEKIEPWRFDTARNISLSHVPEDVDICVCTDLDEVFRSGWRSHLEKAWGEKNTSEGVEKTAKNGKYIYNWSLKEDGTPGVQFNYFKAHSRNGFVWEYPIHECIKYKGGKPLETVFIEGMVLDHYPDASKSRASYLTLLETAVKETPNDDRMLYYLGREYMYVRKWQLCINTLKRHLALPNSVWNEERCASMRWIAHSYHMLGKNGEASKWYFRAMAEAPHMREPFIEFAKIMYLVKDWDMVHFLVNEALKIQKRSDNYVNTTHAWDFTPYDLGAIACFYLNLYEKSLAYSKQALKLAPNDTRLINNHEKIEKAYRCQW